MYAGGLVCVALLVQLLPSGESSPFSETCNDSTSYSSTSTTVESRCDQEIIARIEQYWIKCGQTSNIMGMAANKVFNVSARTPSDLTQGYDCPYYTMTPTEGDSAIGVFFFLLPNNGTTVSKSYNMTEHRGKLSVQGSKVVVYFIRILGEVCALYSCLEDEKEVRPGYNPCVKEHYLFPYQCANTRSPCGPPSFEIDTTGSYSTDDYNSCKTTLLEDFGVPTLEESKDICKTYVN